MKGNHIIEKMAAVVFPSLLLIVFLGQLQGQVDKQDDRVPLYLLNILPFPDDSPGSGWDRADELIPAAQLAVDQINNASGILPGYKLQVVSVDAEACGITTISKGLVNTYANFFDPKKPLNVVGFTGLFCSTVTEFITSVFGIPEMTYLQLAGSTTPQHRDSDAFPWLVHTVSSSIALNNAVLAILRESKWRRISTVYDSSTLAHKTTKSDLERQAMNATEFNVTRSIQIDPFDNVFPTIINSQSRIVYVSALNSGCAEILCEAYHRDAIYPGYVYILLDRSIPGLISEANITNCSPSQIMKALEGVFFLRFGLANDEDTKLVSNVTYREYYNEYLQRLMEIEMATNNSQDLDKNNTYANAMYDQIWAFALALGNSLKTVEINNITLDNLQLQQSELFANIVKSEFQNLSFEGATGFVNFESSKGLEVSSVVNIYQVINGTEELVRIYKPLVSEKLIIKKNISSSAWPPDSFETRRYVLPPWLSTLIYIVISVCMFTTALVVLFMLVYRHRPEVKASSQWLNMIMITGCYFLYISCLTRNLTGGYQSNNYILFTVLCNIEIWLWMIGLVLLLAVLLFRLLRIRHIFQAYGKVSIYWRNKYLVMWISIVLSGAILILTTWASTDVIRMVRRTDYQPNATNSLPYFEERVICSCDKLGIWLAIALSYNGILMLFLVFLAVQTRKIRLSNFKNTKQINIFATTLSMTLAILVPTWLVIDVWKEDTVYRHFIVCFVFLCPAIYCHVFLFLPLVFATAKNIVAERKMGFVRKESQFHSSYK